MKRIYTKQQIIKSIDYWKSVLKNINENTNSLLNELFVTFHADNLIKPFTGKIDNTILDKAFKILNRYVFSSRLPIIPMLYGSDDKLRDFLITRNM